MSSRRCARFVGVVCGIVGLAAGCLASPAARADANRAGTTRGVLPKVLPKDLVRAGADSVRIWAAAARAQATDRAGLVGQLRKGLRMHDRFLERAAGTYPRDQLEWILITDEVADTLSDHVEPLILAYAKAHPDEVLSEGRQRLEVELAQIPGAPPRLHGFNFVALTNWALGKRDEIEESGATKDQVGLEDGVLRYVREWSHLYQQSHENPRETYTSRINQEDWIIARLKDACGNPGKWRITEQWMADLGPDSTQSPPVQRFAHEFHLRALECPEEVEDRVLWIDLPQFVEFQKWMSKQSELRYETKRGAGSGER